MFFLPMSPRLIRLQNRIDKQVLAFARYQIGQPKLDNLENHPELDRLTDLLFLSKLGIIECSFIDSCSWEGSGETLLLKLNLD